MANDFTADSRIIDVWRFENNLNAEKAGNDLTGSGSPAYESGAPLEGAYSLDLESTSLQYASRADADLSAGFPLKSGDAVKKITVAFWIKPESVTSLAFLVAKWGSGTRSFAVDKNSADLRVSIGYNSGASGETWTVVSGLCVAGRKYHIGVALDGVAKTCTVRVWDDTAGTATTYTHNFVQDIYIGAAPFLVGTYGTNYYDGLIDEVVVADDLLSVAEIDAIRTGDFGPFAYTGQVPLTLTPQGEDFGPRAYAGQVPLTLTPQATYGGPAEEVIGQVLLRLIPIATTSLFDPGEADVIPVSTGGWAMGGGGVWTSSTPTDTEIPVPSEPTGFYLGGGAEVGEAEVVSTIPATDEIVSTGGFKIGAGMSGDAATTYPPDETIESEGGFKLNGAGVWDQVRPTDILQTVIESTGGFVFSVSGFDTDPVVSPETTEIIPTGGWKLGGLGPDRTEVTYPADLDREIVSSGGWAMGGEEGVWESSTPSAAIIESLGAVFLIGGGGPATSKSPPIAVITGDALGGFALGGGGLDDPTEVYEAWVLSGQAFEPSCWSGFNFNSFAQHGGQSYAAGEDGIYLLDGEYDAGEPINTGARIGPINAGFDGEKRVRSIQYGQGGKDTSIRVTSDEGESGVFVPERDDNRVVVSRNIQGREFVVDVMGFDELSQFEMNFLRLARR